MGSDEIHFNVSLIVRDKVTRECPQTTTFIAETIQKIKRKESGIEPRRFCLPAKQRFTAGPNRLTGSESCDPAQITSPRPLHWPALSWSVGGLVPRASSGQEDYRHPAEGKIFISSLIIAWSSGGTLCAPLRRLVLQ